MRATTTRSRASVARSARRARRTRPRSRASGSRGRRRGTGSPAPVAGDRALDAWDSARLLALMNMAMADGYIAGFKIRYVYDLWRPVTAIRDGDADGNDATAGDPAWDSLQNTPACLRLPLDPEHLQRGGGGGRSPVSSGYDQVSLLNHERGPLRGYHAIVHELLAGGAGERRLRVSTRASTSARRARTGSPWAARSASGRSLCTSSLSGSDTGPADRAAGRQAALGEHLASRHCAAAALLDMPQEAISTSLFDPVARHTHGMEDPLAVSTRPVL